MSIHHELNEQTERKIRKVCLIVLDSVGIGALPDANLFGDEGANTLGHIAENAPELRLPNLQQWGLGCIAPIRHVLPQKQPSAYYGKMREVSLGKDTMTGHWELMGLNVTIPFKTYPQGFPSALIETFERETGRKVIGNKPASGIEILDELGDRQMQTGEWIVYTSADSVFQLAAHEQIIHLDELYRACEIARQLTLQDEFAVGRVIARPYIGSKGSFQRTPNRRDYTVKPPTATVLNRLVDAGLESIAIGKISDIFSGVGVTQSFHTVSNRDGIAKTIGVMSKPFAGLCFTNLVEFDSLYGHRRDPLGYARALMEFDQCLPSIMAQIGDDGLLILTADHGNDPVHSGTDHTREFVPLLVWNPSFKTSGNLGVRATFADVGATICDLFDLDAIGSGTSFLAQLV